MAHKHQSKIRYVQRQLEKETGVKVSYNWVLTEVDKRISEAFRISREVNRHVNDVLLEMIRPHQKPAESTVN